MIDQSDPTDLSDHRNLKPQRTITVFLLLTLALSSVFYWPIMADHSLKAWNGMAILGLAWSPGIAGMFTRLLYQKNLHGTGWGRGKTRYQVLSYALPLLYCVPVYGIVWLTGLGGVPDPAYIERLTAALKMQGSSPGVVLAIYIAIVSTLGIVWTTISAAGEEIGWRGVLVPELMKITTYTRASLVSGAIWAVWHFPLIFMAEYNAGTPAWFGTACFTLMIVGTSFAYVWLRSRSGSVWTAVLLHASHNLFIQTLFDPLTIDRGVTRYFISEFGAGLAVAGCIVGFIFWRKRGLLAASPREEDRR